MGHSFRDLLWSKNRLRSTGLKTTIMQVKFYVYSQTFFSSKPKTTAETWSVIYFLGRYWGHNICSILEILETNKSKRFQRCKVRDNMQFYCLKETKIRNQTKAKCHLKKGGIYKSAR